MSDNQNYINQLKQELTDYINLRMELLKLTVYEKSAKVSAAIASVVVMMFLGFFMLLFVFLAAAYWIGGMLNSLAAGYAIVALFYLVLLIAFIALRKNYFEKNIMNKMIEVLTEDEDEAANQ